MNIKLRDILEL